MAEKNQDGKQVGWRISDDLRELINIKAKLRNQTAEEFVIECMKANTEDVVALRERYTGEKKSGKKPIVVSSPHESKTKGSR